MKKKYFTLLLICTYLRSKKQTDIVHNTIIKTSKYLWVTITNTCKC